MRKTSKQVQWKCGNMIKLNSKNYVVFFNGKKYTLPKVSNRGIIFNEVGLYNWRVPEYGTYEITLSGGCVYSDKQNSVYKKGELITKTVTLITGLQTTIRVGKAGNNKYSYKSGGKNGTWYTVEASPSEDSVFSYQGSTITAKGASGNTNQKYESNNDGSSQYGYCFIRRVR